MKSAIVEAHAIDEVKLIRDKAEAYRYALIQAKESLEVQNNVAEIKIRAERRIGEFSKELPVYQGERTDRTSHHNDEKFKTNILKEAGIDNYNRYETIANMPDEAFEEHINLHSPY